MNIKQLRDELSAPGRGHITLQVPPLPAADLAGPESCSRAADAVPCFAEVHRSTGRSIAALYREILEQAVLYDSQEEPPSVAAARRLLYADPGTERPTQLFKNYLHHKNLLDAERAAGRTGEAEWGALQSAQPGRIEAALATLSQHRASDLRQTFRAARTAFAAGQREGAAGPYHLCNAAPSDFWLLTPGVGANPGWPGRSSVRVTLDRPWLQIGLLSRAGWSVPGRQAGYYSTGKADDSNTGLMALIPVALFIGWEESEMPVVIAWESLVVPRCPSTGSP